MYFVNSPYIISNLSKRNLIWSISTSEKEIFLTFDDGPQISITPWVLDLLKDYKAKATFFCVGENVMRYPDIYDRILSEGHSTGNHTFNHFNAWGTPNKDYFENIAKAGTFINSYLFRPPYGKLNIKQIRNLRRKYAIVLWSVLSGDFDKNITPEKCLENVVNNTKKGSIVVFHDSLKAEKNLRFALPEFLDHFSKQGFVFSPLSLDYCIRNSNVQNKFLASHIQVPSL